MTRILEIPFVKYHGLENDWVVTRAGYLPRAQGEFARKILDRHTGVGGDGLIGVMKREAKSHDGRVQFWNADGSEAEMSGNGIRCAGAFLLKQKSGKRLLEIETAAGLKSLECRSRGPGRWTFRVGMGPPVLEAAKITFRPGNVSSPVLRFYLPTQSGDLAVTVTSMGNPHCSVFVADFEKTDWQRLGREIERNEHFPNRTNVEFVRPISKNEIEVRFWERGVGYTRSSGTGSCAASVAGILNGLTERLVRVRTEAGILEVAWPEDGEVFLTGPVERVMRGVFFCLRSGREPVRAC